MYNIGAEKLISAIRHYQTRCGDPSHEQLLREYRQVKPSNPMSRRYDGNVAMASSNDSEMLD